MRALLPIIVVMTLMLLATHRVHGQDDNDAGSGDDAPDLANYAVELPPGVYQGNLSQRDVDTYTLNYSGAEDQGYVDINVTSNIGYNLNLVGWDANGHESQAGRDNDTTMLRLYWRPSESENDGFRWLVSYTGSPDTPVGYNFTVEFGPVPFQNDTGTGADAPSSATLDAPILEIDQVYRAEIGHGGDVDRFRFRSNDHYRIFLEPLSTGLDLDGEFEDDPHGDHGYGDGPFEWYGDHILIIEASEGFGAYEIRVSEDPQWLDELGEDFSGNFQGCGALLLLWICGFFLVAFILGGILFGGQQAVRSLRTPPRIVRSVEE